MMRRLHFLLLTLLISCLTVHSSFSQNLSCFINIRNEFYVFEDSATRQLDYLPPESYQIGGNCIAYIDNRGTFRIYQFGSISTPINGVIAGYQVSNDLVLVRTGSLYAFDQGQLNLLTRFVGPYVLGDSVIGFIDYASRDLYAYYNGKITLLKQGKLELSASLLAAGSNVFAYKTYDNQFAVFYHDSAYVQDLEFPQQIGAGNNVVAYIDEFVPGLQVFFKGETKTIEEFNPRGFYVANDLIAYITMDGDFKIFWNGNIYYMGNYNVTKLVVKDNLVLYNDRLNFLYAFYNGKSYKLENFIPDQITGSQSTIYYYDLGNQLKIFSAGMSMAMPLETYLQINSDYDVVKMQLQGKRFIFFSNGKVY